MLGVIKRAVCALMCRAISSPLANIFALWRFRIRAAGRSTSWKRTSYSKCMLTFIFSFAALAMNATAQHSDAASAARQKLECVNLAESILIFRFCSRLWFKQYCCMH